MLEKYSGDGLTELLEDLATETISKQHLEEIATRHSLKTSHVMGVVRAAIIDDHNGPPIQELVDFFGDDECRKRLRDAALFVQSHAARKIAV